MSEQTKLLTKYTKYLEEFCETLPDDCVHEFNTRIDAYLIYLKEEQKNFEFLNLKVANDLAQNAKILLNDYKTFNDYQKGLIVFAVRYFLSDRDLESDTTSITGFDDDVDVMNYVLKSIGKSELTINLD